jgi:L-threonylcarbamoyladenylate synthase
VAVKLLEAVTFPLAAPSANKSGGLSPTSAEAVSESLRDSENLLILDGGSSTLGIESTVIDCSEKFPRIIRVGAVSKEEISEKCGLTFVSGLGISRTKHCNIGKKIALNATSDILNERDALLAFGVPFENGNVCGYSRNLSATGDLNEAAANFFRMLQELDKTDAERICVMPIPELGIGQAINDRLRQAVDFHRANRL